MRIQQCAARDNGGLPFPLTGAHTPPIQPESSEEISRSLSFLCLSVCAVMFGVGLLQGKDMLGMFLTAVSLAVAAIPELSLIHI